MNHVLAKCMDDNTPKFNKIVLYGNAKERLVTLPAYLHSIFRSSLKSLNPRIKLE